jgi:hypothetical protein
MGGKGTLGEKKGESKRRINKAYSVRRPGKEMGVNVTAKEVEEIMVDSMILKDRESWEKNIREGKGKKEFEY